MMKTSFISVLIVVCLAAQVDMAPVTTTPSTSSSYSTSTVSTTTAYNVEERATAIVSSTSSPDAEPAVNYIYG